MPTPMDRALQSRNLFFGFAGLVAVASFANLFGGDIFPAEKDPKGAPETWTEDELRRWLKRVSLKMLGSLVTKTDNANSKMAWSQARS